MIRKMASEGKGIFIAAVMYGLWLFNGLLYTSTELSGRGEFVASAWESYCSATGLERKMQPQRHAVSVCMDNERTFHRLI